MYTGNDIQSIGFRHIALDSLLHLTPRTAVEICNLRGHVAVIECSLVHSIVGIPLRRSHLVSASIKITMLIILPVRLGQICLFLTRNLRVIPPRFRPSASATALIQRESHPMRQTLPGTPVKRIVPAGQGTSCQLVEQMEIPHQIIVIAGRRQFQPRTGSRTCRGSFITRAVGNY